MVIGQLPSIGQLMLEQNVPQLRMIPREPDVIRRQSLETLFRLIVERQSFLVEPASLGIPETKVPEEFEEYFVTVAEHHDNFLNCIRTRTLPHSDIEIGHRSTSVCLLGNIAIDLQRRLVWDGRSERFINDQQANRHLYRPYRAPWYL